MGIARKITSLSQRFALEGLGFEELLRLVPAQVWVRSPDFKISYQNFDENFLNQEDRNLDLEVMETGLESIKIKQVNSKGDQDETTRCFQVRRIPLVTHTYSSPSVLGFATDITEFYRSIEGCEKLLSSVSHDLKNPITAILLSASVSRKLLTDATSGEHSDKSRDDSLKTQVAKSCNFMKSIERSCQTIMSLISAVLDSTRSSSGEVPLRCEKNDIYDVIEEVVSLLRPLALKKSQELCMEIEAQKIEMTFDRVQMIQVFSNLIGNAIKFTDEGGNIIIKMRRMNGEILFEVKDNGKGISREQLPYVFNRYWQGNRVPNHGIGNGVGLGLSIAKKNVESHGGKIWIESVQGKGTQVFFTLPN